MVCEDIQFEANPAHPLGHRPSVKVHAITGIDTLLPVERQAVGVFRDRDLCQQRFGRQATLDDMGRGQSLDDAVPTFEGVFRASCNDDPELRRYHIQPFSRYCQVVCCGFSGSVDR